MRCPGQDQRFWKPDDIFEINCPACGTSVEFWKDEPQVKCPNCKHIIVNPKLDLGCAKWCKYAQECLGQITGQKNKILSNKLIEYLRDIAGSDQNIIRYSLEMLRYAEKIQLKEGGDPLIVKASAILFQVYCQSFQLEPLDSNENTSVKQNFPIFDILIKNGVEKELIDHVCRILNACQSDRDIDSLEFKIIWDACHLVQLQQENITTEQTPLSIQWKTQTAKQLAQELAEK